MGSSFYILERGIMNNLIKNTGKFLKKNSSIILTGLGAIGVAATAVLAVKATPKAMFQMDVRHCELKLEHSESLSVKETIKTTWKYYIPTALTGAATITCIVLAEVTNQRKQISLTNAYSLAAVALKEYQHKVEELYGENANQNVRESIARDHVDSIVVSDDDRMLFCDFNTLQYFESTMTEVITAEYNLNRRMIMNGEANLVDFYIELGVPLNNDIYGDLWCLEPSKWVDFEHDITIINDDLACCVISIHQ